MGQTSRNRPSVCDSFASVFASLSCTFAFFFHRFSLQRANVRIFFTSPTSCLLIALSRPRRKAVTPPRETRKTAQVLMARLISRERADSDLRRREFRSPIRVSSSFFSLSFAPFPETIVVFADNEAPLRIRAILFPARRAYRRASVCVSGGRVDLLFRNLIARIVPWSRARSVTRR